MNVLVSVALNGNFKEKKLLKYCVGLYAYLTKYVTKEEQLSESLVLFREAVEHLGLLAKNLDTGLPCIFETSNQLFKVDTDVLAIYANVLLARQVPIFKNYIYMCVYVCVCIYIFFINK